MSPYLHKEAFCLMLYVCQECGHKELLWNSRDGVTPFSLTCVKCLVPCKAYHKHWEQDRRLPDFKPEDGMRIFVDLTPERARHHAEEVVAKYWEADNRPMSADYSDKQTAIKLVMEGMMQNKGAPDIIIAKRDSSHERN